MQTGLAVEKLFSENFSSKICSQVIECSFAVGAEIHTAITAFVPFSTGTGDSAHNPVNEIAVGTTNALGSHRRWSTSGAPEVAFRAAAVGCERAAALAEVSLGLSASIL
jgi:hypothetical protein